MDEIYPLLIQSCEERSPLMATSIGVVTVNARFKNHLDSSSLPYHESRGLYIRSLVSHLDTPVTYLGSVTPVLILAVSVRAVVA